MMKHSKKICRHLHLPLQSGSTKILKAMNRRYTKEQYLELAEKIRREIPDMAITTDIIVGFPGETETDFSELEAFVRETRFDRLGVFQYSPEEGTPAFHMKNQIASSVKEDRYCRLMELQQQISKENNLARVGKTYDVLVEGVSEDGIFYYGRSYAEGPDVDGRIYFTAEEPLQIGEIVKIEILIAEEYDLTGRQICV